MKPHFTNTINPIDFPKSKSMINERIRELAEQSTQEFTTYFDGRGNVTETYFDKEKFAELIVRECFDVVIADGRFHDARRVIRAGKSVALEHFGVEE